MLVQKEDITWKKTFFLYLLLTTMLWVESKLIYMVKQA